MASHPEINQRDLRLRSKEIMDSIERGQAFTVTRGGHPIGELISIRRKRTFLSREQFTGDGATKQVVDVDRFRSDLDTATDDALGDPYRR